MRNRLTILIPIILILSGCGSVRSGTVRLFNGEVYRVDTPWWDPRTEKLDPSDFDDSLINIANYCFPEDIKVSENFRRESLGQVGGGEAGAQEQKNQVKTSHECVRFAYDLAKVNAINRDRFQDILIAASDRECDKHKASVLGTNNGLNLGLSMLTSLLAGAATGFSANSTKTALSAASAFFGSSRSQINEQVYQQLFVGTILLAVDDDRKGQLLEIVNRRRYPVPMESWDPRASGRPLGDTVEVASSSPSSTGQTQAAPSSTGAMATTTALQPPVASDAAAPQSTSGATSGDSEETSLPNGRDLPQRDFRQFYGVDEAIRDAKIYHDRCSFYNGLVRLATKVEEFSPCRMVADRRERLLAELTAIQASNTQAGTHKTKFDAYQEELKVLNTKLAACTPGGSQ